MLEPAVRPGAAPVQPGQASGKPSFENRSFDDLLAEANQPGAGESVAVTGDGSEKADQMSRALQALGGLGQIENAALRDVLAQQRVGAGQTGSKG